jgi:spore coat polysaccharide biosynthesis protein SpsF
MNSPINLIIGIQARSTSTRLPGKCFEMIAGKRSLDYVIRSAQEACHYLNKKAWVVARPLLLIPKGDAIKDSFKDITIFEGPELDVLTRYWSAVDTFSADVVVRITGDCPMLPSRTICDVVIPALKGSFDYMGNSDEEVRSAIDGVDVEVITKRLLEHMYLNANDPYDREHVTPYARRKRPEGFRIGTAIDKHDLFDEVKWSIDTKDDLERVRAKMAKSIDREAQATLKYGKENVRRI